MRSFYLSMIFAVCCSLSLSAQVPAGFISHYTFDGNVLDDSGFGLHGTEHGTTLNYVDGIFNQAIEFNNVNHGPLDVNDYVSFPPITTTEMTIAFMAKYRNTSYAEQGQSSTLYSLGNTKLDTSLMVMHKKDWGPAIRLELVSLFDNQEDQLTYHATEKFEMATNEWVHIAISFDRQGIIRLFMDGELKDAEDVGFAPVFNNKPFFLAYHEWHNEPFSASRYNGLIDEMYVYDKSLNEDEVQRLFQATIVTAANDQVIANRQAVYPNPCIGECRLMLAEGAIADVDEVRVYTVSGQEHAVPYMLTDGELVVDLGQLDDRAYIIEAQIGNERIRSELVVKQSH